MISYNKMVWFTKYVIVHFSLLTITQLDLQGPVRRNHRGFPKPRWRVKSYYIIVSNALCFYFTTLHIDDIITPHTHTPMQSRNHEIVDSKSKVLAVDWEDVNLEQKVWNKIEGVRGG